MSDHGINPMEYKVLVKPSFVEEKTKGGIILPQQSHDKEKYANDTGVLVAVGSIAFTEPRWLETPKIGEKVMFDKYAGIIVKGNDDVEYRLMNDKEICAVLEVKA